MSIDLEDGNWTWLPRDHEPRSGPAVVYRDKWWTAHPDRGLLFYTPRRRGKIYGWYPQCNSDRSITERLAPKYPGIEITYVPLFVAPARSQEW